MLIRLVHDAAAGCAIRPDGWLGDRFDTYRQAIAGAAYDRKRKISTVTIDKIPPILVRLREAGFATSMDAEVHRRLQQYTAQQWTDLKSAQDRIERIDDEIHRRLGKRMFVYQKIASQWLVMRRGALLADEPGLGKTLTIIAAIPANAPVVVVAPASAKGVWLQETRQWRPHVNAVVLSGRNSFRWPAPGEMAILNYAILPKVHRDDCDGTLPPGPCTGCSEETRPNAVGIPIKVKGHAKTCTGFGRPERCPGCATFLEEVPPGTVFVWDEAHALKDPSSQQTRKAQALSDAVRRKDGRVWTVTGTPMENEPKDLWYVMRIAGINTEAFDSWATFVELFQGKALDRGFTWGLPDGEVAERIQRVAMRRMKSEVQHELPEKIYQQVIVDVDAATLRACDHVLAEVGGADNLEHVLTSDVKFETMSRIRAALASAKIPALVTMIDELERARQTPLVVFSMHRAPVDKLACRPGWASITGDDSAEKRADVVAAFQEGKLRGLACTIQAAGTALTLTRSNRCIFVDLSYKPTANDQAEARVHRVTQDRGVIITILKANHPLDERVTEILMTKRAIIAASVDAASILDEATLDRSFEDQIRQAQKDIAAGRAVRRMAETEEEIFAVEKLHAISFRDRSDERLAERLAEQSTAIGLSDAQWSLALRLIERVAEVDREKTESDVRLIRPQKRAVGKRQEAAGESEKESKTMASKKKSSSSESGTRSPEPTSESAGEGGDERIDRVLLLIKSMDLEERQDLFDLIERRYCVACAEPSIRGKKHVCPLDGEENEGGDEDDEDDEDEDGDDTVATDDDGDVEEAS